MRKLIIILLLTIAWPPNGTIKYYIIPAGEETPFIKRKLTWFWGIDAIEIANGDFAIPEKVDKDLDDFAVDIKLTKAMKDSTKAIKDALKDFPKEKEEDIEWKIYELE